MSRWLIISITILLVAGCRGTRKSDMWQSILDAEKRALEDRMHQLEIEVATLEDQLESTRRENDALRSEIEEDSLPAPRRQTNRETDDPVGSGTLEGPVIELEGSSSETLPIGAPHLNAASGDEGVAAREASHPLGALGQLSGLGDRTPEAPADDKVVSIYLNPMLTGGDDTDNRPGDEGISVVIEPRNKEGAYVPQAGSVAIVVLDPSKRGPSARVARWDFDIGEVSSRLKKTALGRGIHLSIPWPNRPPENERLHLFVRYTSADQRRMEADKEIRVDLKGKISARWTPAASSYRPSAVVAEEQLPSNRSPYVTAQQPVPYAPPVASDPLESRRIAVNQSEDASETNSQPEQPARKLQRPVWIPVRK